MRTSIAAKPYSLVKQPLSFPRRVFCARVLKFWLRYPDRRGGGAPRIVRVLARHPLGLHVTRQARRWRGALRPSEDARLPALHRGGFGLRSRASLTGIYAGSVTASSSRPGRSARRAGSRTSRGGGCESLPQDATPRSVL